MDREDIIRMARKSGMQFQGGFVRVVECVTESELERFAHLVAEREREACAKAAEKQFEPEVWQRLEKTWLIGYDAGREAEREACAVEVERARLHMDGILSLTASTYFIASRVTDYLVGRIRARGGE